MIKFKLNSKSIDVPSDWNDPTFNQYSAWMQFKGDYIDTVSLWTNIPPETLRKSTLVGIESVITALGFLNKPPVIPVCVPKVGKYTIPLDEKGQFNVQYKRLDQFEDMRQAMIKDSSLKGITESYPVYVSIYLQAIRDKEYDHGKAMAMVEEVREMPALEVISLGSFFLIKQLSLLNGTQKTYPSTRQVSKKSKQGSKNSKRSSGRMARSTGSRGR